MSFRAEYEIGKLEFRRIMFHPIVIVIGLIITGFIYISNAGGAYLFEQLSRRYLSDAFVLGFSQTWDATTLVCMTMAAFFGATSVSRERWDNSINVVLTKPLYKRDYLIGKLMGVTASLLVFIVFSLLITGLITAMYFRGPLSMSEFAWRIIVYIILLTLSCCLVAALNMFLGVLSKNMLFVVAASMTYIFAEWFWNISVYLPGYELISPVRVNGCMFGMGAGGYLLFLFDTLCPFTKWFSYAVPYIAITIIELVLVLLISIAMFSRSDNV